MTSKSSAALGFAMAVRCCRFLIGVESLIGCLQWMLGILSDRIDIKRGYERI